MGLLDTFREIPEIVFDVFEELIIQCDIVNLNKSGWSDGDGEDVITRVSIIPASFEAEEVALLSFRNVMQPTDVVLMVRGTEVSEKSVVFSTSFKADLFEDGLESEAKRFSIIASDTDPAKALYSVLIRKV